MRTVTTVVLYSWLRTVQAAAAATAAARDSELLVRISALLALVVVTPLACDINIFLDAGQIPSKF